MSATKLSDSFFNSFSDFEKKEVLKEEFDNYFFESTSFQESSFKDCEFVNSQMGHSIFDECSFKDVSFKNCDLTFAIFRNCSFQDCEFERNQMKQASFERCEILANFIDNNVEGMDIVSSVLKAAIFEHKDCRIQNSEIVGDIDLDASNIYECVKIDKVSKPFEKYHSNGVLFFGQFTGKMVYQKRNMNFTLETMSVFDVRLTENGKKMFAKIQKFGNIVEILIDVSQGIKKDVHVEFLSFLQGNVQYAFSKRIKKTLPEFFEKGVQYRKPRNEGLKTWKDHKFHKIAMQFILNEIGTEFLDFPKKEQDKTLALVIRAYEGYLAQEKAKKVRDFALTIELGKKEDLSKFQKMDYPYTSQMLEFLAINRAIAAGFVDLGEAKQAFRYAMNSQNSFSKTLSLVMNKIQHVMPFVKGMTPWGKKMENAYIVREVATKKEEIAITFPININKASSEVLAKLPGIKEGLAKKIVNERMKGNFVKVEDLRFVKGISRAKAKSLQAKGFATV